LGDRLVEIAQQKAGIIKPGNQVFMYGQNEEVNEIFVRIAKEQNAILDMLSEREEHRRVTTSSVLATLPAYQQRNWLLAHQAYEFIAARDKLPALSSDSLAKSMKVQVPGRMDRVQVNDKTLVMDGAHNGQKMEAFVTSFQKLYPGKKAAVLLGLKEGKEYQTVLPLLLPICSRLIITTFDTLQDLPTNSIRPQLLAEAATMYGFTDVSIVNDPTAAYKQLIQSPEDVLVVTGSFYLLSCIRPAIIKVL
jgi:dihydrofolate synthase / folylpolyglutamate synthase